MLDFDSKQISMLELWARLRILRLRPQYVRIDKTRRGWHVIIPCTLPYLFRIATQAALGSDPKRECFNLYRFRKGIRLNQLFEPRKKH